MPNVKVFWDPSGFELDSLGTDTFLRVTDGDTPFVSMSIRMLSVDTPEVHYPGTENPANHDDKLGELAQWIQAGRAPINPGLAQHLLPKLASGRAGSLHRQQGDRATEHFSQLLEEKLTRPDGSKRPVFLWAADQHFDDYGRLLAYMAPYYTRRELEALSYEDRPTFNLLMVRSGWAAPFPIYPSLPKYEDLVLLHGYGQSAHDTPQGIWAEPLTLTGYEFRMCYKLWEVTRKLVSGDRLSSRERNGWIERYCADMTTLAIFNPQDYHKVAPYNRIFIWPKDVTEAVGRLSLIPGE